MTVLSDYQADLSEALFDADGGLAQAATYTRASGGDPLEIVCLLEYGENLSDSEWRMALAAVATIMVQVSDVAQPEVYDTILVDGQTWTVENIVGGNGAVWILSVTRDLRPTLRR